jgi:CBS domain containing-hemolysin-like protein
LFSSIFGIGYIKLLFKNNKIDKKMSNKHKAMQLFFVTDIISIINIIKKMR